MSFCVKCGNQIEEGARFCPSCGAAVGGGEQQAGQAEAANGESAQAHYTAAPQSAGDDIAENKAISILCYFGILLLIPYLTKRESPFVVYHSNQGIVLLLFAIILSIVSVIPILGWIIGIIGWIFCAVCFILGIVHVCKGEMKQLPLIGKITILK